MPDNLLVFNYDLLLEDVSTAIHNTTMEILESYVNMSEAH